MADHHKSLSHFSNVFQVLVGSVVIIPPLKMNVSLLNTSLAAKGALAHSLQRLQNPILPPGGPNMAARGAQNGRWGQERCVPLAVSAF